MIGSARYSNLKAAGTRKQEPVFRHCTGQPVRAVGPGLPLSESVHLAYRAHDGHAAAAPMPVTRTAESSGLRVRSGPKQSRSCTSESGESWPDVTSRLAPGS